MELTHFSIRLLVTLLELAQEDRPANVKCLAQRLDVRLGAVATELGRLDEIGLVHAARMRLSMTGLVVAAGARARLGGSRRAAPSLAA